MKAAITQSGNDGAPRSRITARWQQREQPHKAGVFRSLSRAPRRQRTTSPRRFVFVALTLLATLEGLSTGEGKRSPRVTSEAAEQATMPATESNTHHARWGPWSSSTVPMRRPPGGKITTHNAPGVSIMSEALRGWARTSKELRGGGSEGCASGIRSDTGDLRDHPRVFHSGVFRRGGAWITGYSDTTEDEDKEEETEEETSEEETPEEGPKTLGEEMTEGDGKSGCTIAGETVEMLKRGSLLPSGTVIKEDGDEEVFYGEGEVSTSGFGWGAEGPSSSVHADVNVGVDEINSLEGGDALVGGDSEAAEDDDEKENIKTSKEDDDDDREEGDDDDEGNGDGEDDYDERKAARASGSSTDVYARTVARRRAVSSTLRVFQKAFLRTAVLLVAFQMLPWLRHNVVAQWLLLGSIFLQTVNEIGAVINAFGGDGRNSSGDKDRGEEASTDTGMGRFNPLPPPSTGLYGGMMRAISPEHEQKRHFDFERLNDYFDKDSEALASAGRSKADMAALLAAGAAEDTRLLGASVLRAMKGLTGSHGRSNSDETRSSGGDVKKGDGDNKKRKKQKNKQKKKKGDRTIEKGEDSSDGAIKAAASSADARNVYGSDCGAEGVGSDSPEILRRDGSEMEPRSNGSASSGGDGYGNGNGNATVVLPRPVGKETKKRVFVVKIGSGTGGRQDNSEMELLSGAVSFLIAKGNSTTDEVVVCLESGGGEVSEFGLGASKLARLRDKGFRLTVCVDKVAASGGYMMACVANRLIAAPFAMLGSIGVVGGIPNFNKALKKAGIEYFHFTAGQRKSLVGPFQEVTKANQVMQQRQIDGVHSAFKRHVGRYRPTADVEAIGTGEIWLGLDAIKHCLVDELGTAMEYLESRMADSQVFLVKPHTPRPVRSSSLLRLLLLGPLAAVGRTRSSSDTIGEAASLPMDNLFSIPRSRDGEGME